MKKQDTTEVIELLTRAADGMRRWLEQQNKQYEEEDQSPDGGSPETPEEGIEQSSQPPAEEDFIGCGLRSLPRKLILEGAATAVSINPANAPVIGPMAALGRDFVLKPLHLALLTSKYWGKEPRTISVSFMENCPQDLRDKIISHMNGWADGKPGICIRFAWTQGMGEVRISRGQGGYYSYLGTDILHIPRNQQTMNLQGFTMQTRDSEFYRVVRHETGHCLTGDTFIDCPRDLEKHPLGIPIRDLVGKRPWVYAWQGGQVVIRKAARVWLSKRRAEVVRVKLKTGQGYHGKEFLAPLELVGTPDHLVLLADGETWKPLGKLCPGDRLCSLYRSKNGPRSRIRWTGLVERVREHAFVCEQVYGDRPEGYDAHHKNERMLDQTPENLEWKEEWLHRHDHSSGRVDSPETSARRSQAQRDREPPTDETRAKMAANARNRPPISEETRRKISQATRGREQSEELRARKREAMRLFYENGGQAPGLGKQPSAEARAKRSASMKATLARKRALAADNHVVVSVGRVLEVHDVYDMTVPGADSFVANGVVVHNSLGFPHEHMRRELVARINPQKAIEYFRRTQGWDANAVRQQVLTPLEEGSIMGTPGGDETSIMCYQLPGSITVDGKPIVGGEDINATDREFAFKLYPGSSVEEPDIEWPI